MINICLNFVNANLVLGVIKLVIGLGSTNKWDLANLAQEFAQNVCLTTILSLLILPMIKFLIIDAKFVTKSSTSMILSIKISEVNIWQKPKINHQ